MCCGCFACSCKRQTFYYVGLVVIGIGIFGLLWGFFSTSWVQRIGGQTLTADSVERYGLWKACAPDSFNSCRQITDMLPQIEGAAQGSRALITLSLIFIVVGYVVEIVGCLPIETLKEKSSVLFDNRVVEFLIAVATVVGFVGMLVFAAEVKNKAHREVGQEDGTGRGFGFSITGQLMVVFGCCLLACGRRVSNANGATTTS
ncbi:hypothetical protein ACOMHN_056377 [Nucella lapillus]